MAELLIEEIDFQSVENKIITESTNDGKPVKKYWLNGPHADSEVFNGNDRMYPKVVVEKNVLRMNQKEIPQNRLLGECGHPNNVDITYERVSHLIKELKMDGNIAYGRSLVLDTPLGKVIKSLMDEGVKVGTSTRGTGTVKNKIVQGDWYWKTNDLVHDQSGPSCLLSNIYENREWVFENGLLTEKERENIIAEVDKVIVEHQFSIEDRQSAFLKLFNDTLNKIKQKHF
jgi:hypothetical protein